VSGRPTFDVVIAGGGPAGSTLAALLAEAGRSVALCDAARFPRHKICGEYVPPAALAAFARLGVLDRVLALGPRRHVGMAVVSPGGTEVLGRYGDGGRGLALRRYDLDPVLLDGARSKGAVVLEGARLSAIERAPRGGFDVTVRRGAGTEVLRGRVLVGADGRNSFVARRLGLRRAEPRHRKWAVMAHVRGGDLPRDHGEMIVTPYGYCGINPLPDGLANVCVVVERGELGRSSGGARRLDDYLWSRILAHPATRRRLEAGTIVAGPWATGPLACRAARAVDDSALLVGDAAGFYDPFTGEGIGMALRGAEIAAAILDTALRRGRTGRRDLAPYEAERRRAFGARLRLDRLLQRVLGRPRLADWVARRLRRDPSLADLLTRVAGDTTDASEILRPRFLARLMLA